MDHVRRQFVPVVVVLLVVLAGCSLPVIDGGEAETGASGTATTTAPSQSTAGSTGDGTEDPTTDGTDRPTTSQTTTASPTATPTPEPTPTVASETGIRVVEINADVENITDEYVVLKNTGDAPLDLSGWRVKDEDGHVYTFPDGYTLGIDETVTLHSAKGTQTKSDRYWWADSQVWGGNGDTISIFDDRGHKVYERSYS